MNDNDDDGYNNTHRAFLQAFMAKSTFTFSQAKPVLAAIISAHSRRDVLEEDISQADFENYINTINVAVSPYDLEIRDTWTQATGDARRVREYALVNTTSDGVTQLATTHTADEIAYVKRVLDAMFEKNNTLNREVMGITQIEALRLNKASGSSGRASGVGVADQEATITPATGSSLTAKEAEKMLGTLVKEGWFERRGDFYTLSARALMELRTWLMETYNEPDDEDGTRGTQRIKLCQACKDIVTIGQRCSQKQCLARLHDQCTNSFFRAQGGGKVCPLCRTPWTGEDFVGERATNRGGARGSTSAVY